jgi:hypothetical protein
MYAADWRSNVEALRFSLLYSSARIRAFRGKGDLARKDRRLAQIDRKTLFATLHRPCLAKGVDMTKQRVGRKTVPIALLELEKLCSLHCTDQELADWFGVSTRTIEKRRKRREFAEAMQRGRSRGQISVRRAQMKILEGGNSTMGVWLGKQFLGQRDMITTEHVGAGGGAIQMSVKPDLSKLTDEELERLLDMAGKTAPAKKSS